MCATKIPGTGAGLEQPWQHQDIPAIGHHVLKHTGTSGLAVPASSPG